MKHKHQHYMKIAIRLSYKGLGLTSPNPSVGCVIVKNQRIIATGTTQPSGRPHAEVVALEQAGKEASGSTVYVTLEPCSHYGKTPPCVDALIKAKVKTVIVAIKDVNPAVNGKGIRKLREHGITVIEDICHDEAYEVNRGFFLTHTHNRPMVTLKIATSIDGKIATSTGKSQWITGDIARNFGHLLRSNHDAIAVGSGTVLADDPSLNCRLNGLENQSPKRIVFDRRLRITNQHQLIQTASEIPTFIITSEIDTEHIDKAASIIKIDTSTGLQRVLSELTAHNITRLLIEGGGHLAASFLKEQLVDHLYWIQAPVIIGNDGISAVAAMQLDELNEAPQFSLQNTRHLGKDTLHHYTYNKAFPS